MASPQGDCLQSIFSPNLRLQYLAVQRGLPITLQNWFLDILVSTVDSRILYCSMCYCMRLTLCPRPHLCNALAPLRVNKWSFLANPYVRHSVLVVLSWAEQITYQRYYFKPSTLVLPKSPFILFLSLAFVVYSTQEVIMHQSQGSFAWELFMRKEKEENQLQCAHFPSFR